MASKDIYGGGNFGAIAGSLLSQRRSGFKKAIGVSVIENILGQLNLSNKEESNNNSNQRLLGLLLLFFCSRLDCL